MIDETLAAIAAAATRSDDVERTDIELIQHISELVGEAAVKLMESTYQGSRAGRERVNLMRLSIPARQSRIRRDRPRTTTANVVNSRLPRSEFP